MGNGKWGRGRGYSSGATDEAKRMDVQDTLMPFIGALEAILRGRLVNAVQVVGGRGSTKSQ